MKTWMTFIKKLRGHAFADSNVRPEEMSQFQERLLFKKVELLMHTERLYLKHELGRKDLVNALHTNERYLAVAIRKFAGKTINEYINDYRLEYAVRLLTTRSENFTIESVAYESGFSTLRHFYRLFQSKYKTSPAKYRRMYDNRSLA